MLLSHLFYRILNETTIADAEPDGVDAAIELPHKPDAYILVNHEEQLNVYTQIALKLRLQKKKGKEIIKKPSTFIKNFSVYVPSKTGRSVAKLVKWSEHDPSSHYVPEGKADIVLIDEAHLLTTQGNQGYSGSNMLADILRRARVVVMVFDPRQILHSSQRWPSAMLNELLNGGLISDDQICDYSFHEATLEGERFRLGRIQLTHQFRIEAQPETQSWLESFMLGNLKSLEALPHDTGKRNALYDKAKADGDWQLMHHEPEYLEQPYDLRVFDSPVKPMEAIKAKSETGRAARRGVESRAY